jgi:hypothetical protein
MEFKNWFLIEDSNLRKLQDMLIQNGFTFHSKGKGDHEKWIRDGFIVSIDRGNIRNPKAMYKQYLKRWQKDIEFKQAQAEKRDQSK